MKQPTRKRWMQWALLFLILAVTGATCGMWWPALVRLVDQSLALRRATGDSEDSHGHEHAGHDHAPSAELSKLTLTEQAFKNLGLTAEYLRPIELTDYRRTVSIPAVVSPMPGRTEIRVSALLAGVIEHIHAVTGEAVMPGDLLFEVRLTDEELVANQSDFLKSLNDLQVEEREIVRLTEVTQSGAVASKVLLDRQYTKQKLEGLIASQREALRLHGLSDAQIAVIQKERRLLRQLSIVAPEPGRPTGDQQLRLSGPIVRPTGFVVDDSWAGPVINSSRAIAVHKQSPWIIERLVVQKGQGVTAGQELCTLSDVSRLYIEGQAFEQDIPAISQAVEKDWPLAATLATANGQETLRDLRLAYVANSVDAQARTLSFFTHLPNAIVRDEINQQGQRFVTWKYRVGQRLTLQVPVEVWEQQIVVPIEAITKDGGDWFIFQRNGMNLVRIPVHLIHRDQIQAVIANDGAVFVGDVIAMRAAHQLQMALKNQSGGAMDPHAGHSH
ncbi:MAG: efflux RND transporter periplasmic adaptor subunit [Pirellulaceae bacterium]|nr:efflux RND transporter periplasmic adaptor subunit [Pirellulaceae bacterium]